MKRLLLEWYKSGNSLKRWVSCFLSHFYLMSFYLKDNLIDANRRTHKMKSQGLINNRALCLLDMLFCYLVLGYFPETYASIGFQNLSFKKRLTFVPPYENILFATSLNHECNLDILHNKNKTYEFLKDLYGREQIIIRSDEDFAAFSEFISIHKKFFYKPIDGTCGVNSGLADSAKIEIFPFFKDLIKTGTYVIEELIVQCDELASFHPSSVNTIRAAVFKSKNGTEILYGCLRCGQGDNVVDNGAAGGIFIPFNINTGRLNKIGFDEIGKKYLAHPDSNISFEDFQIPRFDEIKSLCVKITEKFPGLKYVGWDIAISKDKLIVVEGNEIPTLIILEGLHKTGFKKELREIACNELIPDGFRSKIEDI